MEAGRRRSLLGVAMAEEERLEGAALPVSSHTHTHTHTVTHAHTRTHKNHVIKLKYMNRLHVYISSLYVLTIHVCIRICVLLPLVKNPFPESFLDCICG